MLLKELWPIIYNICTERGLSRGLKKPMLPLNAAQEQSITRSKQADKVYAEDDSRPASREAWALPSLPKKATTYPA